MSGVQVGAMYRRVSLQGAARLESLGGLVVVSRISPSGGNLFYRYMDTKLNVTAGDYVESVPRFLESFEPVPNVVDVWSYERAEELYTAFKAAADAYNAYIAQQPKQCYYPASTEVRIDV